MTATTHLHRTWLGTVFFRWFGTRAMTQCGDFAYSFAPRERATCEECRDARVARRAGVRHV